ncbi:helix-turn-helix domain-containing protein [Lactobacillus corticis]|uniref:HTH cro/C1-type domain-containing protein n=1 Tax=Lactobacillus corticis TaxID=2201249 RepID=A0A916QFS9_9LACO|nr:Rgg/GadR/MutR family transcriptional regulator [Lactobacillus corticis]GFZ26510.1 hypothetical protein LCB40_03900 [Lactobacillus corticis]
MSIGEKLKKIRREKGLTQKEMAADIVSVSYYAKVERGENNISADMLLALLEQHHIDIVYFFQDSTTVNTQVNMNDLMIDQLTEAYYQNDKNKLATLTNEVYRDKNQYSRRTYLYTKLIETSGNDDLSTLTSEERQEIKDKIFSQQTWTNKNLELFCSSMRLYNFWNLSFIVNSILVKEALESNHDSDRNKVLCAILVNFIHVALENEEYDLAKNAIYKINRFPNQSELFLYKAIAKYYEAYIAKDKDSTQMYLYVLRNTGYKFCDHVLLKLK